MFSLLFSTYILYLVFQEMLGLNLTNEEDDIARGSDAGGTGADDENKKDLL